MDWRGKWQGREGKEGNKWGEWERVINNKRNDDKLAVPLGGNILTVVIENARGDTGGAIGIAIHRLHHADALLKDGAH